MTPIDGWRNPATGEEITIAAEPASVDLRARPLTKAKAALPSVQKPDVDSPPDARPRVHHAAPASDGSRRVVVAIGHVC